MKAGFRVASRAVVAALLAGTAGLASAQGSDPPKGDDLVGEDDTQDIVVQARRIAEPAQDVPVSLTAVTGQTLKDLTVKNLDDIQKVVPNIRFQQAAQNPSGYSISIRGQSPGDSVLTQDSPVGIYLDGVFIPRTTGLKSALNDIAQIEVLRGPQGTLYGRNTTGGAVSIYTVNPSTDLEGYVRARVGTYGERDLLAVVNLPVAALDGGIRIVGSKGSSNGYGQNAAGTRLGSEDRESARAKLLFHPASGLEIMLSADYSNNRNGGDIGQIGGLIPADRSPTGAAGGVAILQAALELGLNPFNPDRTYNTGVLNGVAATVLQQANGVGRYSNSDDQPKYDRSKTYGFNATIAYDLSPDMSLKSITGYRHLNRYTPATFGGTQFTFLEQDLTQRDKYFSEEIQFIGKRDRFNWVIGAYYGRERGLEASYGVKAVPLLNPSVTTNEGFVTNDNLSGYAQASFEVTEALTLTGGIRYSSEGRELITYSRSRVPSTGVTTCTTTGARSTESDAIARGLCELKLDGRFKSTSFLASVDYKVAPNLLTYAKVSRGFVSGGQNLRGNFSVPASLLPFKPEQATQYELGEKADLFDRRLRLNSAIYYTDYVDLQRVSLLPPGVIQAVTNAASARIWGAEVEASLRPSAHFSLNASAGYTDTKYRSFTDFSGDHSDQKFTFPKWTANLGAAYDMPTGFGSIRPTVNWRWQSAVVLSPAAVIPAFVTQPAFSLVDARVAVAVDAWRAEIAIHGQNLLNKRYIVATGGLDGLLGFDPIALGPPRTGGVEFTLKF